MSLALETRPETASVPAFGTLAEFYAVADALRAAGQRLPNEGETAIVGGIPVAVTAQVPVGTVASVVSKPRNG